MPWRRTRKLNDPHRFISPTFSYKKKETLCTQYDLGYGTNTKVPRKYSIFVPCGRDSAATTRYTSSVTTHITPLLTPQKLWGSCIENIKRLNHFLGTETASWLMQWPYPSPYVTATPAARIDFSPFTVTWAFSGIGTCECCLCCYAFTICSGLFYFPALSSSNVVPRAS